MMGLKANLTLTAPLIPANCTGMLPDYRELSTAKTDPHTHAGTSEYLTGEGTLQTTFAIYLFSILWAPNHHHHEKIPPETTNQHTSDENNTEGKELLQYFVLPQSFAFCNHFINISKIILTVCLCGTHIIILLSETGKLS